MKRFLAFLLALIMVSSLAINVFAEPSVVRDGNTLYSESTEISESELYDTLQSFYEGTDYASLASAAVKKALKLSLVKSESYDTTIDESSFCFVLDNATNITKNDSNNVVTLSAGSHTVSVSFNYHTDYTYQKYFGKATSGSTDDTYSGSEKSFTFTVRLKTVLNVERTQASIVYGTENPAEAILNAINPTVSLMDGTVIGAATEVNIVEDVTKLGAGQHTITVKYPGLDKGDEPGYQPATAQINLTIRKAPTSVEVVNSTVTYDGKEHMVQVNVTPENVPYTSITVGIQGDASGFASIYMSEGNALYNALVFLRNSGDALNFFAKLIGIDISDFIIGSEGVSLEQLRNLLTNITDLTSLLAGSGINLEESQIGGILQALETIEKVMPDINVRFYIKNMPKNQGIYATCAVATDENHSTALDFGYTTISPDFKVDLQWRESTDGYNFTKDNVGDFNFKAYVTEKVSEEVPGASAQEINTAIQYKITGLTAAGEIFSSNSLDNLPTQPGVYTETAYVLYNYVTAGIRTFVINRDEAFVKFVDQNGNLCDSISVDTEYDGQGKTVSAVVVDEAGNIIEDAKVSYAYTGETKSGNLYVSTNAPANSGNYTVKATFAGNALYSPASNSNAKINVLKAEASITFDNVTSKILKKVDYSTVGYTFEGMTADEAARIAATLGCGSRIHLLIGTHKMSVTIPDDIAEKYDVTVNGAKHTVKLFG